MEADKPARPPRKSETKGKSLKTHIIVDRKYYEGVSQLMAQTYLKRVEYLRYLMGIKSPSKSNNLLNIQVSGPLNACEI